MASLMNFPIGGFIWLAAHCCPCPFQSHCTLFKNAKNVQKPSDKFTMPENDKFDSFESAVEIVNELRKNQNLHFDLQIHPTLLNSTYLHCQMTGFVYIRVQKFQNVEISKCRILKSHEKCQNY